MQRELQEYQRVLWKQRRERFFLLRKRSESSGKRESQIGSWSIRKGSVFPTLRKPFFAYVLLWPQHHYRMLGWGRDTEWRRACTPAMYGCWWVFLCASFFPVCLMCIFSPSAFRTQWHTFRFGQGTAPDECEDEELMNRDGQTLAANVQYCFIVFLFFTIITIISRAETRTGDLSRPSPLHWLWNSQEYIFLMHVNARYIWLLECS